MQYTKMNYGTTMRHQRYNYYTHLSSNHAYFARILDRYVVSPINFQIRKLGLRL